MLRAQLGFVLAVTFVLTFRAGETLAGPFAPGAGQPGTTAIAGSDSGIVAWATSVEELVRGPLDIANPGGGTASFGAAANALGPSGSTLVSLGDGGRITLGFAQPITNGPGADFAVFENGFASGSLSFLEIGFVEVSSNGTDYFRFDAVSLTPVTTQIGSFGLIDPTNLNNFAGKYIAGFGTPFDLAELAGRSPLLDVNDVKFVRVIDAIGTVNPLHAALDSAGTMVNEPYPTAFASGGFDFDAVAVIHQVPEPAAWLLAALGLVVLLVAKQRGLPILKIAIFLGLFRKWRCVTPCEGRENSAFCAFFAEGALKSTVVRVYDDSFRWLSGRSGSVPSGGESEERFARTSRWPTFRNCKNAMTKQVSVDVKNPRM
jgi:hypothetical protein